MGGAVAAALLLRRGRGGRRCTRSAWPRRWPSGIIEANRTGGTVKRLHCGWAAHAGVTAAQLVARGFTGPPTVLEGRFGFFEAWLHGQFDADAVTDGLGRRRGRCRASSSSPTRPTTSRTPSIDAAAGAARARGRPRRRRVGRRSASPPRSIRTIGEPIEVKRAPETGYQAQFSGPYAVAAGLLGGGGLGVGLDDFTDELAQDPQRRALMAKVDVVADDAVRRDLPAPVPGRAHAAHRTTGDELVEEVLTNRGGPGRPLSSTSSAASSATTSPAVSSADAAAGRLHDGAGPATSRPARRRRPPCSPPLATVLHPTLVRRRNR